MSRRRSKHLRGAIAPGLMTPVFGFLKLPTHSVNPSNVLMGMGVGVAGALGFRYLYSSYIKSMLPASITANDYADAAVDALGAILVGVGVYQFGKKTDKAYGLAIGSAAAGLGLTTSTVAKKLMSPAAAVAATPAAGLRTLQLAGLVVPDRNYKGIVAPSGANQMYRPGLRSPGVQMAAYRAIASRRR